jgi:pentatricopeptide repeat protein
MNFSSRFNYEHNSRNVLFDALCTVRRPDLIHEMIERMPQYGFQPTTDTFNALMKGYFQKSMSSSSSIWLIS